MTSTAARPAERVPHWPPAPEEVPVRWADIVGKYGESAARRKHHRVRHGYYLPKSVAVTPQSRALAAARSYTGAILSGATAAHANGHPWPHTDLADVVLTPAGGRHRRDTTAGVHCIARPPAAEPTRHRIGGAHLLVASPLDTTIDCVHQLPDDEATAFLDGAIRTWGIGDDLATWAERSRRTGSPRMRRLLPATDARAESRPESILRTRLRDAGDHAWVPQYPVPAEGNRHFIDLADPHHRIALEYQGAAHWDDPARRQADADRVNRLRRAGWTVIEITAKDLWGNFGKILRDIAVARRAIREEWAAARNDYRGRAFR